MGAALAAVWRGGPPSNRAVGALMIEGRLRPEGARRWRIAVINGPNMPNLGQRDPKIYGPIRSLADLEKLVAQFADLIGVDVVQYSSNHEGDILDFIHRMAPEADAFVINPAGLTTYGEATRHALADTGRPYVEVHFANTARHFDAVSHGGQRLESRFTFTAAGLVMGLRQYGYLGALLALSLSLDDSNFLGARMPSGHPLQGTPPDEATSREPSD